MECSYIVFTESISVVRNSNEIIHVLLKTIILLYTLGSLELCLKRFYRYLLYYLCSTLDYKSYILNR